MKFFRKIYYDIKYFIQRGKRGYSNFDLMDMDSYLLDLITNMLKNFKNKKDGFPSDLDEKSWDDILKEMIERFEKANPSTTDFENPYLNLYYKEEYLQKNLEQGFKLLVKYFHHLWY